MTITVTIPLTDNDIKMLRAFIAWQVASPKCSAKRQEIEYGYGNHRFKTLKGGAGRRGLMRDMTGPRTFDRLKAMGIIVHSPNGHCWLSELGAHTAMNLAFTRTP